MISWLLFCVYAFVICLLVWGIPFFLTFLSEPAFGATYSFSGLHIAIYAVLFLVTFLATAIPMYFPYKHLDKSNKSIMNGDFEGAIQSCNAGIKSLILKGIPLSSALFFNMALSYFNLENYEETVKSLGNIKVKAFLVSKNFYLSIIAYIQNDLEEYKLKREEAKKYKNSFSYKIYMDIYDVIDNEQLSLAERNNKIDKIKSMNITLKLKEFLDSFKEEKQEEEEAL